MIIDYSKLYTIYIIHLSLGINYNILTIFYVSYFIQPEFLGASMGNRENARGSGFVIDTWEMSAGGSGAGGESSRSSGPRSDGSNSLAGERTGIVSFNSI